MYQVKTPAKWYIPRCEVPMHIRNAPIEGMKKDGYGVGYKYPHDYPGHYVEQQYLPDKMVGTKYFIKDENCE